MPDPTPVPGLEPVSLGRRVPALFVDWFASTLVVIAFVGWDAYSEVGSSAQPWVLVVFALEAAVLTAFAGGSFGKLLTGLRTVRADGRGAVDLLRSTLRAVLVCLVVPPLVFRPDGRGLHDLASGSVTVRATTLRGTTGR